MGNFFAGMLAGFLAFSPEGRNMYGKVIKNLQDKIYGGDSSEHDELDNRKTLSVNSKPPIDRSNVPHGSKPISEIPGTEKSC
jgi:hypothetical protein